MTVQPDRSVRLTGVAPMFLVDDVEQTAEWYREHLGFAIGEYFRNDHDPHDDEPNHPAAGEAVFVILNRDGNRLMLGRRAERGMSVRFNRDASEMSADAYFWVDGIETLFGTVQGVPGTVFLHELVHQPYGLVEFMVKDCDGRALTFGGEPAG